MQELVITIDIDWAPDFVINEVADQLLEAGVRATWFVTHESSALDRLRHHGDLFELGIHPNFLQGSTQGDSPRAVLHHCLQIIPDARAMRTHALFQSTPLLEMVLQESSIRVDLSLFLPHAATTCSLDYHWGGNKLTRIPYVWEDDFEMMRPNPIWRVDCLGVNGNAFVVLDFHPIHLYLNHVKLDAYEELKKRCKDLVHATPQHTKDLVSSGEGPRSMFHDAIQKLRSTGGRCIRDLLDNAR